MKSPKSKKYNLQTINNQISHLSIYENDNNFKKYEVS
jgi:hypothetical protein